ncbi:hypothetical protein GCM10009853_021400 [Glycomyces scopariae]
MRAAHHPHRAHRNSKVLRSKHEHLARPSDANVKSRKGPGCREGPTAARGGAGGSGAVLAISDSGRPRAASRPEAVRGTRTPRGQQVEVNRLVEARIGAR